MDLSRARPAETEGGASTSSSSQQGPAHHPPGSSKGGQFTANPNSGGSKTQKATPARKAAPPPKPLTAVKPARRGAMKRGGSNDPAAVKQLQGLLGILGLGQVPTNGEFDEATEAAVKAAQERLGLKPTGRASTALVNKLLSAHALSPCIKRSEGVDEYELIRSAAANGEYDEDSDNGAPMTVERCCPDVFEDESHVFRREWDLDGIDIIRSGAGGDGRTVDAYATVFDRPAEIRDQHGHYMETIHRSAFDEVLRSGISRVKCFYNHGMDIHGKPSDTFSIPIGTPLEVRADGKGLRTITRYNEGPVEDRILEAIRNQAITAYSFRGPIRRSDPPRVRRVRDGEALPTVTRMTLGLTEYGPTPMPYYADAGILALRSRIAQIGTLTAEQQHLLAHLLAASTPEDQEAVRTALSATPSQGPGAEDQPAEALRSATTADIRRKIALARRPRRVT